MREPKTCNTCLECLIMPTEHGIVRRCKAYKKLLEESHTEKERPKWCEEVRENEAN